MKSRQDLAFASLHAQRIGCSLVIKAKQMKTSVHHEMRPMISSRFTLLPRLSLDHGSAEHDVPEPSTPRMGNEPSRSRKRQHVRRIVPTAPQEIETSRFGRSDYAQCQLGTTPSCPGCLACPCAQTPYGRHSSTNAAAYIDTQTSSRRRLTHEPSPERSPRASYASTMRCTRGCRTTSRASKNWKATP